MTAAVPSGSSQSLEGAFGHVLSGLLHQLLPVVQQIFHHHKPPAAASAVVIVLFVALVARMWRALGEEKET